MTRRELIVTLAAIATVTGFNLKDLLGLVPSPTGQTICPVGIASKAEVGLLTLRWDVIAVDEYVKLELGDPAPSA
jgi:hypothetical protein